jgi:3-hydroxymyristoyl/3-hydroxydecanoyl-(acyl carrier protein) dehydratase
MTDAAPRLLPTVLAERRSAEGVELDLLVGPELAYFAGHFPGLPILPGVVQIDWAVKLAREKLGVAGEFAGAENLKFLSIVKPGARPTLSLGPAGRRLRFSYDTPARAVSSGILLFA